MKSKYKRNNDLNTNVAEQTAIKFIRKQCTKLKEKAGEGLCRDISEHVGKAQSRELHFLEPETL